MTNLAREIARLREAPLEDLLATYARLHGEPPGLLSRNELWRRCAWRLQADAARDRSPTEPCPGELRVSAARTAGPARRPRPGELPLGTELLRTWRGHQVRVLAVEDGFLHDGVVHRSLSAVARAVTGSHWNGRLFFGLVERQRGVRPT